MIKKWLKMISEVDFDLKFLSRYFFLPLVTDLKFFLINMIKTNHSWQLWFKISNKIFYSFFLITLSRNIQFNTYTKKLSTSRYRFWKEKKIALKLPEFLWENPEIWITGNRTSHEKKTQPFNCVLKTYKYQRR